MTSSPRLAQKLPALALAFLAFLYLAPVAFILRHHVELGRVALGADVLLSGQHLYKDYFSEALPGSYFLAAAFMDMLGSSWWALRLELYLVYCLSSVATYFLSKRLINGAAAFLPAAIYVIVAAPSWCLNYFYWDALFWQLLHLWFATEILDASHLDIEPKDQTKLKIKALAAGITGSLAIICFQGLAPAVGAGSLCLLFLVAGAAKNKALARKLIWPLAGGLVLPLAALALYFLATNTLAAAYDCTFASILHRYGDVNRTNYGENNFLSTALFGPQTANAPVLARVITICMALTLWWPWQIVYLAPLAVVVMALVAIFGQARQSSKPEEFLSFLTGGSNGVTILFCLEGFAFWAVQLHRPDNQRLFWGGLLLLVVFVHMVQKVGATSRIARFTGRAGGVMTAAALALYAFSQMALYAGPKYNLDTRRGLITALEPLDVVAAVVPVTRAHEPLFVYPYDTAINYLTMTAPASSYPFLLYRYHSSEQINQALQEIEAKKVKYAVWDSKYNNWTFADLAFPSYQPVATDKLVVERYLRSKFAPVKSYGHYQLWRRR